MYFEVLSILYDRHQVHVSENKVCIVFNRVHDEKIVQNLINHDFLIKKYSFSLEFDHIGAYYLYHIHDDIDLVVCNYSMSQIFLEIALKKSETM